MADPCRVCITFNLAEPLLERIREAAGADAIVEVLPPGARQAYRGAPVTDSLEEPARQELDELLRRADILYTSAVIVPGDLYERAPKLRWVQVTNAGVDPLFARGLVNDRVAITNASGVHATPIGEWVVGAMLAFAKGFPQLARRQQRHEWARLPASELRGSTCGIIGMGAIGAELRDWRRRSGCAWWRRDALPPCPPRRRTA